MGKLVRMASTKNNLDMSVAFDTADLGSLLSTLKWLSMLGLPFIVGVSITLREIYGAILVFLVRPHLLLLPKMLNCSGLAS